MSAEWERAALRSRTSRRSGRRPWASRVALTAWRKLASVLRVGDASAAGATANTRKAAAKTTQSPLTSFIPASFATYSDVVCTPFGGSPSPSRRHEAAGLGRGAEDVREL